MGEVVQGYNKIVKGNEYPIASSSRKGLYLQTDYFNGERSGIDESLDFHLVPQGYVTYRHMSDDSTFHFNRNSMNTPVLVSKEYPVFTNKDDNNLDFILYHLNSTARFASFSHMQKKGGTRVRLYFKMLETYKLYMPASAEQKKVGAILKQWENTIALHQEKLEALREIKTAFLEKIFNQEIRFSGFEETWEQRKWIDTVDISTNMVDPKIGNYDELPHIGPGNIESFTGRLIDNVNTVKEDNLISSKFHFDKGDVIYGKINPQLGKYIFAPYEGLASADTYVLNGNNGLDQTFLFALLQTKHFFKYSLSVSMRSGIPKINRDELNVYSYMSPSNEEQELIGRFFMQFDDAISLHHQKIDSLHKLKCVYLQKMFL